MNMSDLSRRRFVYGTGAALAVGGLAGCTGNGDDDDAPADDENGDDNGDDGLEAWLDDQNANEWDGSLEDHTGEDEVQIDVGGGDDGLAFTPTGITVDAGTTIVWEWTGDGGNHNVHDVEGDYGFQSDTTDEAGFTFEETLDDPGEARYVCDPHAGVGMYGGILVE